MIARQGFLKVLLCIYLGGEFGGHKSDFLQVLPHQTQQHIVRCVPLKSLSVVEESKENST